MREALPRRRIAARNEMPVLIRDEPAEARRLRALEGEGNRRGPEERDAGEPCGCDRAIAIPPTQRDDQRNQGGAEHDIRDRPRERERAAESGEDEQFP